MKNILKTYNVKLNVLTPVFVGSGREISKKEYRLCPEEQKISVYDPYKLYAAVKKFGKTREYEDFLLKDKFSDLNGWLQDNKISINDIASTVRYSISWGDRMELGMSKTSIMEFIKDPYGKPYIPGTSIKGMLRTILLGYEIATNMDRFKSSADSIKIYECKHSGNKNYQKESAKVEALAFRRLNREKTNPSDAVNDILQGLIVSDSRPLNMRDLVLCQKIEYHTDKQKKPLNLLRECIKPGSIVNFTLTIDSSVCKYDVDTIMSAIETFNDMYYKEFLAKFGSNKRPPNTVYLGGGVGFVSKTFIYYLFKGREGVDVASDVFKNTLPSRIYLEHKHKDDKRLGVSPHIMKCTNYQGKCYQMGMCKLTIDQE